MPRPKEYPSETPMKRDDLLSLLANPVRRKIVARIAQAGKAAYSDLLNETCNESKSRGDFNYHLNYLVEAEVIVKEGAVYRLTKKGSFVFRFLEDVEFACAGLERVQEMTSDELDIWTLARRGITRKDIARRRRIPLHAVDESLVHANAQVSQALAEVAKKAKIQTKKIYSSLGILVGYSPEMKGDAYVYFSETSGLEPWYVFEGMGRLCPLARYRPRDSNPFSCDQRLRRDAEELGVVLTQEEAKLEPSLQCGVVFKEAIEKAEVATGSKASLKE